MRSILVVLALLASVALARGSEDDPLLQAELRRLVWAAVDAPDAGAAAALDDLTGFPGATWRDVHDVLAGGRHADELTPPAPARDDLAEHIADLAAFPWKPGVVRTYDLRDVQPWFYSVTQPPSSATVSWDEPEPPAVLLDLGAFAPQAQAPAGWIVVRLADGLAQAPDVGGAPLSLTAGTTSQSVMLSVLADLERRVRFDPDRVFVSGFSRGGNAALYFGVHWPDRFAGIAPASGYYPFPDSMLDNLDHVAVLAARGDDRGHRAANEFQAALVGRLTRSGGAVTERAQKGRATDGDFGDALLAWAAATRRDALPRAFRYTLNDPRHRGAYWAEIVEVESPGGTQRVAIAAPGGGVGETFRLNRRVSSVEVDVVAPNDVRVRARNLRRLRLLLSPALFDLETDVTVRLGDRTLTLKPAPTIATLITHFRRDHDRARLFPATLDLAL